VRFVACLFICSALIFAGCGLAHDAGVVATAPFRIFHHPSPTPTPVPAATTVTTTRTQVQTPRPSPSQVTALETHRTVSKETPSPTPGARSKASTDAATPKLRASPSPSLIPLEQDFPTAKAVPDKPGYVFSPSEPAKYVDVSGYPPGSKVKDPYSGKIFLVP
jgi:hypothetical protein